MIRELISMYRPGYPNVLVYMLQACEYKPGPYVAWLVRTKDFTQVMQRRTLEPTKPARLLLLALRVGILVQIALGIFLIYLGATDRFAGGVAFGIVLIVSYPLVWAYLAVVPLLLGRELSAKPRERHLVAQSEKIFVKHPGQKIAVAGSYGKTTMKELLKTVLSQGLKVAATPANKNVSISHARFAAQLSGDEDVLVIEYGEGQPGDVARFAQLTHPTHGVITGLAAAHLDEYKTVQAAGEDIFSLAEYLEDNNVYVNDESPEIKPFLKESYAIFDQEGALGWQVEKVKVSIHGTSFSLVKGKKTMALKTKLLGRHHVGFLAFTAAFGLKLGLTEGQVQTGIAETKPFEHRMQPYQLGGAWIIDDTYNGNLEGVRAGTNLLRELAAKRKIYVTPGLVDQGIETERIHTEVGRLIAAAKPEVVVLMQNSVTAYIRQGLESGGFGGTVQIESRPLDFYTNLNHFVAAGDLVMMQNDWTDNYA